MNLASELIKSPLISRSYVKPGYFKADCRFGTVDVPI